MELRPYQSAIISASRDLLRTAPVGCVVAPTGAGKTVIFTAIAKMVAAKGGTVLILVNRTNLLRQTADTIRKQGVPARIVHGQDFRMDAPVIVSTVQTFRPRFRNGYKASVTVIDECHLSMFDGYVRTQLAAGSRVLGFTATPARLDKKKPMAKVYQQFCQPAKTHELIRDGWLVRPKYFATELDLSQLETDGSGDYTEESQVKVFSDTASLIRGIKEHGLGKALVFCTRVQQAYDLAAAMTADGLPAACIHGGMDEGERKRLIHMLDVGTLYALVNADLLTFGFDMTSINTVVLYRATTSLALLHQMIGRGARLHAGKDVFHVLDFGSNLLRLGLWEEDIDWQRHFDPPKKKDKESTPAVKVCKACGAFNVTSAKVCKECGEAFANGDAPDDEQEQREVRLVEFANARYNDLPLATMPIQQLIEVAQARNYKKSWIHYVLAERPDNLAQLTNYFTHIGKPDPAKSAAKVLDRLTTVTQ